MKTLLVSGPALTAGSGMPFGIASTTRYLRLAGQFSSYQFGYTPDTTEGDWRTTVDAAGTINDLEVYISANNRLTATTFTLMKNGVSTGYTATVGAGVTGWVGASGGPVAVATGDLLSLRMVTGTGGGSLTIDQIESTFETNDGTTLAHYFVGADYGINQTASTSRLSQGVNSLAEGNSFATGWAGELNYLSWACRAHLDATAESIRVDIPVNSATVASRVELFKNNVATGLFALIPAGTTGRFRGTGSVDISPGDVLDIRFYTPTSGSGAVRVGTIQTAIRFDGDGYEVWAPFRSSSTLQGYNDQTYRFSAPVPNITLNGASAWTRTKFFEGRAANLWARVNIAGSGVGDFPVSVLTVNGSASTLGLTIPSGTGGNFTFTNTTGFVDLNDGDTAWLAFRTTGFSQAISAWGFTVESTAAPPVVIEGNPGTLNWTGKQGQIIADQIVTGGTGALNWTGRQGAVVVSSFVEGNPGSLDFSGQQGFIFSGTSVFGDPAALNWTGQQGFVSTEAFVAATQSAVLVLGAPEFEVRASQSVVLMIGEIVPDVKASQSAILVLVDAQPCVSRRADIWVIERRDGERMAFTSHDLPIRFGTLIATPCGSLTPTAIEQASEISGVGNMELQGLITSARITEADLYAGLYDDAFVEVWRVSWDDELPETPIRMAAGWWGNLTHGADGFSAEVLGPGSRIQQQALVQMVTPGCRRVFGSPQGELPPSGCGVNRETYKVTGGVAAASNRARFVAVLDGPGTAPQYANGLVRWLSGPNAGTACEVKSVDFPTGTIILWSPTGFLPNEGDDFELLPGCDKLPETCKLYSNYINFGGFPDVPGTDAISETPDAKL